LDQSLAKRKKKKATKSGGGALHQDKEDGHSDAVSFSFLA